MISIIITAFNNDKYIDECLYTVVDSFKDCIVEAGKEEGTIVKLNAVLKATGEYTDDLSRALNENAKALMNKSLEVFDYY